MNETKSKHGSDIAPMILPAAVILVLYGMWVVMRSLPGAAEVAQAEQQLAALASSQTTHAQVAMVKQKVDDVEAELKLAQQQLVNCQHRAGQYSGQTIADAAQLQELGTLDRVFRNQQMRVVADRTMAQRGNSKLAASLDDASEQLFDKIQASLATKNDSAKKNAKVPYIPSESPPGVSVDELRTMLEKSRRGKASETQLREVEVVGTYGQMLTALDELNECCGNSVVVGVAVKRPSRRAAASNLRHWTLQLQVRPMPAEGLPGRTPNDPELQLASDTK